MCTVSIIRLGDDLLRLACNRDEQRSRPMALPPRITRINARLTVMPIDPTGGGTWIAANDAGVVMALLNRNLPLAGRNGQRHWPARGLLSRGQIIPSLIGCSSVDDAIASALGLDARRYGPFTMVLVDRDTRAQVISDGFQTRVANLCSQDVAALFTSSGLGDHLVEAPRLALFEEMLRDSGMSATTQDRYHRHHWPNRENLSVCMRRPDARTVSHTIVELGPDRIDFRYHAAAPDEPASNLRTTFPLIQSTLS
jgi:hypothetical protein